MSPVVHFIVQVFCTFHRVTAGIRFDSPPRNLQSSTQSQITAYKPALLHKIIIYYNSRLKLHQILNYLFYICYFVDEINEFLAKRGC